MYLVAIAWIYVAAMMAVAEAVAPNGSLLGAGFTFLLYGILPLSIVLYILATPARRRNRSRPQPVPGGGSESGSQGGSAGIAPDAGGKAPAAAQADRIPSVREKA